MMSLVLTLCLAAPLAGGDSGEADRARLWGVLSHGRVSVRFESAPLREAIEELRRQLDAPLIGRFDDDRVGHGLDPDAPVTLERRDANALFVLEEILEQADLSGESTWQLRSGFIEVGTKARLSVPAACERRLYYIRDFMLDTDLERRLQPEIFALDMVETIVETIEPEAWDYGQIDYDQDDRAGTATQVVPHRPSPPEPGRGATRPPAGRKPLPRYVAPRKIASIRYWRDVLIVTAPDYIHRQIDGYPAPVVPAGELARSPATHDPAPAGPVLRLYWVRDLLASGRSPDQAAPHLIARLERDLDPEPDINHHGGVLFVRASLEQHSRIGTLLLELRKTPEVRERSLP